jgi:hypothetical protein
MGAFRTTFSRLTIIFVVVIVSCIHAFSQCACEPEPTVENHFRRSEHVFVGEVVSVSAAKNNNNAESKLIIQFEVIETWKNDLTRSVSIVEIGGTSEGLEVGARWLVYAVRGPDSKLYLNRDCCSRTKPWKVAKKRGDLRLLRKLGERPKRIL